MLTLYRTRLTPRESLGVLCWTGIPLCFTLERPWKDNQREVSCIPPGLYRCQRVVSEKFGETLLVTNVPNRDGIVFHCGNTVENTKGCILVGCEFEPYGYDSEPYEDRMAMYESRKAFDLVMPTLCQLAPFDFHIIHTTTLVRPVVYGSDPIQV